jgi:hypothetical protein
MHLMFRCDDIGETAPWAIPQEEVVIAYFLLRKPGWHAGSVGNVITSQLLTAKAHYILRTS